MKKLTFWCINIGWVIVTGALCFAQENLFFLYFMLAGITALPVLHWLFKLILIRASQNKHELTIAGGMVAINGKPLNEASLEKLEEYREKLTKALTRETISQSDKIDQMINREVLKRIDEELNKR